MSIESSIEQRIREAIARGEFDNLPGKGKPLDLDAYFNTPEELRMAFAMLKSNEFVPEEVEMLKEIKQLRADVAAASDETEKAALIKKLNERTLALTIALEKYRRKR
jgi:hypothetical protein